MAGRKRKSGAQSKAEENGTEVNGTGENAVANASVSESEKDVEQEENGAENGDAAADSNDADASPIAENVAGGKRRGRKPSPKKKYRDDSDNTDAEEDVEAQSSKKTKKSKGKAAATDEDDDDNDDDRQESSDQQPEEEPEPEKKDRKSGRKSVRIVSDKVDDDANADAEPAGKRSKRGSDAKKTKAEKKTFSKEASAKKDDEEDNDPYEVEAIVDDKIMNGKKHFLIRWKGYSPDEDTWEPENTLSCPEILKKYLSSKKKSKKGGEKSKAGPKIKMDSANKRGSKTAAASDSDEDASETEYEVERIIDIYFKKSGKREFLVRWKGFTAKDDTWEPEEHLNCKNLVEKFMDKVEKARSLESKELRVNRQPTNHFSLSSQEKGRRLSRRNEGKQRVSYREVE